MAASTRSLLLEDGNPTVNDNGDCNEERSHDSSITPILVLSTFIAVCGSFCYGFAVSTLINIITMFLARSQRFLY
jgi:SP family facilitated glucose transporter-like MFS transporter 8